MLDDEIFQVPELMMLTRNTIKLSKVLLAMDDEIGTLPYECLP